MTSLSLEATPRDESFGAILLDSQFRHYPVWAPKTTSLAGQTAVITGASTGLGLEAGRQLLGFDLARLVMAVRSPAKGEAAAAPLRRAFPAARIDVWVLEMESYTSVQAFARRVDADLGRVDLAILNAGLVPGAFQTSRETGHETCIQVNYLSTMLLAILLLPVLKAKRAAEQTAPPARLTIVNSGVSLGSKHPWQDSRPLLASLDEAPAPAAAFDFAERYRTSKLLGQLFFIKLFPHVSADDVVLNMVDPGFIRGTSLSREAPGVLAVLLWLSKIVLGRRLSVGASTYVDAAVVKGKASHGCFVMDWAIRPFAKFAYSDKGKAAMDVLWAETLQELEFANVGAILRSLKG